MTQERKLKKLVQPQPVVYCAICGQRQQSKELFNHRDASGKPCRSYYPRTQVQA